MRSKGDRRVPRTSIAVLVVTLAFSLTGVVRADSPPAIGLPQILSARVDGTSLLVAGSHFGVAAAPPSSYGSLRVAEPDGLDDQPGASHAVSAGAAAGVLVR